MGDFRNLVVWQRSHQLVLEVYRATGTFPVTERYTLTSQTRRAAVSVAANVAEGCGRNSRKEFARFVSISLGSANEVSYLVLLCKDLKLLSSSQYQRLSEEAAEIRRMLAALVKKLREGDN